MQFNPILAFFSGVGVALCGALIANILTKQRDRRRFVEQRRFDIYMRLIELYGLYFWFYVKELQRDKVPEYLRRKSRELSWQIADMLRSADEVDYLEDVLDVVLGPGFPTASDRYKAMEALLDRLGQKVNPRYSRKIREISDANVRLIGSGGSSNAPGATTFI